MKEECDRNNEIPIDGIMRLFSQANEMKTKAKRYMHTHISNDDDDDDADHQTCFVHGSIIDTLL